MQTETALEIKKIQKPGVIISEKSQSKLTIIKLTKLKPK